MIRASNLENVSYSQAVVRIFKEFENAGATIWKWEDATSSEKKREFESIKQGLDGAGSVCVCC